MNGTAIICHGRSNALAIKNAIKVASEMVRNKVNDHITEMLAVAELPGEKDAIEGKAVQ